MPADMVAGTRVKIQCVGMRVIGWRELQVLAGQFIEPAPKCRGTIHVGNDGGLHVNRVAADAAALLMPRQIIPIHAVADGSNGIDQSRRNLCRQEILDVNEGTLPGVFAAQSRKVQGIQSGD